MLKRFPWAITFALFVLACGGGAQILFAAHSVDLAWTAPTNQPANSYINVYRGTAPGAEQPTPINPQALPATQTTFTDTNVQANAKYYYTVKQCDVSLATNTEVCSAPSNEAPVTVPMIGTDLSTPGVLTAVAK